MERQPYATYTNRVAFLRIRYTYVFEVPVPVAVRPKV